MGDHAALRSYRKNSLLEHPLINRGALYVEDHPKIAGRVNAYEVTPRERKYLGYCWVNEHGLWTCGNGRHYGMARAAAIDLMVQAGDTPREHKGPGGRPRKVQEAGA